MAIVEFDKDQQFQLPNGASVTYQLRVASAGGALTIRFDDPAGDGSGGEPVAVVLLDAALNVLFSAITATSQSFTTTVPAAGDYSLTVMDFNPSDQHDDRAYTIHPLISTAPDTVYDGPLNNSLPAALAVPPGSTVAGSLNEGDVDVFRFTAAAPGLLQAAFGHPAGKSASGAEVLVELLDSQGLVLTTKLLAGNDAFAATVGSAGDFYLRVSDAHAGGPDGGFYSWQGVLAGIPGAVYDGAADVDAAHAQTLPLSRELVGELHLGDQDFYALSLPDAGKLSFNFLHPGGAGLLAGSIDIRLTDGAGNLVLARNISADMDLTADVPAGGQYLLQVNQAAGTDTDTGIYRFMTGFSNAGGATVRGSQAGASFVSTSGDDTFFGYAGRDSVTFRDVRSHYAVLATEAGVAVSNSAGVDGSDTLFGIDRLYFSDKTAIAYDWFGSAGEVYRLYQAAFDRVPDAGGLGFWIVQHDAGLPAGVMADNFVASAEFGQVYGDTPTNAEIVSKFYEHVLHRAPDAGGIAFWVQALDQGRATVADVLFDFSRSAENFDLLVGFSKGFEYKMWT
jgi:hypothetical protein